MKKIVLTFGLIAGAILAAMLVVTIPFVDQIGFDYGMVLGYSTMVLAFLLVFFGIRSYRETIGDGQISFGKALSVGLLIVVIATVCYVVTWEIVYFNFLPGFADEYVAYTLDKARAAGTSAEELARQTEEMKKFKEMYQNVFFVAAVTFLEPLPVGIPMTFISAFILRKRRQKEPDHVNDVHPV